MKIDVIDLNSLEKSGVYKITNVISNKYYIGSTKMKIRLRLNHHLQALRNNKHKNTHLQNAWNKYGEEAFVATVIENCNKNIVYDREQYYLDLRDISVSYNINPLATGFSENEETRKKLSESHRKFNKECYKYYSEYKNNVLKLNDIPQKFHNTIIAHISNVPWNKGKKYNSTEHLKVKHKITDKVIEKCKNFSEKLRDNSVIVYVYDKDWNFYGRFRSSKDIEDLSNVLNLPIKSRFKNARGKCTLNTLQSCNINRSIKTGQPYKNLYFVTQPLHQGIDDANEPISVKSWNANTEISTKTKKFVPSYSIETEPINIE